MRRLQAGLLPEASKRIGKCLDCGALGAAGAVSTCGVFLAGGACARAGCHAYAASARIGKIYRARKGMRLDEPPQRGYRAAARRTNKTQRPPQFGQMLSGMIWKWRRATLRKVPRDQEDNSAPARCILIYGAA